MKKVLIPALAATAALAGVLSSGQSAHAANITTTTTFAPITQSASFGPAVTPFTGQPLAPAFNKFNAATTVPAPGTLTSVMKTIKGILTGDVTVINQTSEAQQVFSLGVFGRISVTNPNATYTAVPTVTLIDGDRTFAPGETLSFTNIMAMQELPMINLTSPSDLNLFIASGSDTTFTPTASGNAFQNVSGSSNLTFIFNTQAKAEETLIYKGQNVTVTQMPNGTPEPGTLLGLGLLGLGGLGSKITSRRRKDSKDSKDS